MLVDGERVLSDSPVILEYLEERFPEPPLYPADPARRAEVRTFLDWFNQLWKRPPNLIFAEEQKAEPDRARIAELEQRIAGALPLFEDLLAGRDYLFGDELTRRRRRPRSRSSSTRSSGRKATSIASTRSCATRCRLDGRYPRLEAWIHRMDALPRA